MFKVICAECKGIDQCINSTTVENDAIKTMRANTYSYFCNGCRASVQTTSGWLDAWGKRDKNKKRGKRKPKAVKLSTTGQIIADSIARIESTTAV